MLKPAKKSNQKLETMTAEQRARFERAVAEETLAKPENVAALRKTAKRLKHERKQIASLIAQLKELRQTKKISLNELESRTGISKSSLSRLENSVAPNPTLLTLHRYAIAIGVTLTHRLKPMS